MSFDWIFIVLGVVMIVALFYTQHPPSQKTKESPINIAKRRFAYAEVSQAELEDIKHNIWNRS